MKSKYWRVKSTITSKDIQGIPYSLEDAVSKMKDTAFFSEVLRPVTNNLVEELVDKGKLKATKNCGVITRLARMSMQISMMKSRKNTFL